MLYDCSASDVPISSIGSTQSALTGLRLLRMGKECPVQTTGMLEKRDSFTETQNLAYVCKAAAANDIATGQGLCPQCKYGAKSACCRAPSLYHGEVMTSLLCALGRHRCLARGERSKPVLLRINFYSVLPTPPRRHVSTDSSGQKFLIAQGPEVAIWTKAPSSAFSASSAGVFRTLRAHPCHSVAALWTKSARFLICMQHCTEFDVSTLYLARRRKQPESAEICFECFRRINSDFSSVFPCKAAAWQGTVRAAVSLLLPHAELEPCSAVAARYGSSWVGRWQQRSQNSGSCCCQIRPRLSQHAAAAQPGTAGSCCELASPADAQPRGAERRPRPPWPSPVRSTGAAA